MPSSSWSVARATRVQGYGASEGVIAYVSASLQLPRGAAPGPRYTGSPPALASSTMYRPGPVA